MRPLPTPRRPSRVADGANSVSVSSQSAPLCPGRAPQSIGRVAHHPPWAVAGRSAPGTFVIRKRIGVGAALRWMFASAGSRHGQVMSRPLGSPEDPPGELPRGSSPPAPSSGQRFLPRADARRLTSRGGARCHDRPRGRGHKVAAAGTAGSWSARGEIEHVNRLDDLLRGAR